MKTNKTIQIKRGSTTNIFTWDGVPKSGEFIYDYTAHKLKIGNGVDKYSDLPYVAYNPQEIEDTVKPKIVTTESTYSIVDEAFKNNQPVVLLYNDIYIPLTEVKDYKYYFNFVQLGLTTTTLYTFIVKSDFGSTVWNMTSNILDLDTKADKATTLAGYNISDAYTKSETNYLIVDNVENSVTSTSASKSLSANMGKALQDLINQLKSIGKFLSNWNCLTGLPTTNPEVMPYTYHTGDYYLVGQAGVKENITIAQTAGTSNLDLAVDLETFKLETHTTADVYLPLVYDGSDWYTESWHILINPSDYGISIIGAPEQGDTIEIRYTYPITSYRPTGSSYTGTASSIVETEEVQVGDMYIFDGVNWILQLNHQKAIPVDTRLDPTSENAVLNRVIYKELTDDEFVTALALNTLNNNVLSLLQRVGVIENLLNLEAAQEIVYPLNFIANTANSTVKLKMNGTLDTSYEYSRDNITWSPYTIGDTVTLANVGDKVYFRGDNSSASFNWDCYMQFEMSGSIAASGNIMSILDKTMNSISVPELGMYHLFSGCTSLTTAPELPATTLSEDCYSYMFQGCTSLTVAPELPATTLADSCYWGMFNGCTSLTTAPELPATELADYCYYDMFDGCSSLTELTVYADDISAPHCLADWLTDTASGTTGRLHSLGSADFTGQVPSNWNIVQN